MPTTKHLPSISVIIPNYNGRHLMAKHLPWVLRMLRTDDEVVIVDDCSTDDSLSWLKKQFSLQMLSEDKNETLFSGDWQIGKHHGKMIVVANHRNQRFARACNRGVEVSGHSYIFLLNTDVAPEANILQYLLPHFQDPEVFGVGCMEEEQSGEKIIHGGKNKIWFERGMFLHNRADEFGTGDTAWISGGSVIFAKHKWNQLKGFDLAYAPAYWEDVDLSFRARQKGWKVLFEAKAVVHHNHESTNQSAFGQKKIDTISYRNANTFVWRNGTLSQKVQHLLWQPYWWWKRGSIRV